LSAPCLREAQPNALPWLIVHVESKDSLQRTHRLRRSTVAWKDRCTQVATVGYADALPHGPSKPLSMMPTPGNGETTGKSGTGRPH